MLKLQGNCGEQLTANIKCGEAQNGEIKAIIDPGSVPSMVHISTLHETTPYYPNRKITLSGISGTRQSIGTAILNLKLSGKIIPCEFHVITGPAPFNALIGQNFLKKSTIDFNEKKLYFVEPPQKKNKFVQDMYTQLLSEARATSNFNVGAVNLGSDAPGAHQTGSGQGFNETCFSAYSTSEVLDEDTSDEISDFLDTLNVKSEWSFLVTTAGHKTNNYNQENNQKLANIIKSKERVDEILAEFDTSHLTLSQHIKIRALFKKYNEVFKLKDDPLPATSAITLNIPLVNNEPVFTPQYKLQKSHEEEAYKQVQEMLKQGIIRPSVSRHNSPLLVVQKKTKNPDGTHKLRVCVDLRKLNSALVDSFYHLPAIHTLIQDIPRAKYYCSLDLSAGYNQIPVADEDCHKLAFTCRHERFEYVRCCFGLKTAGFCFARMLNSVLAKLIANNECVCYLDDILITGNSEDELLERVEKVLELFQKYNLAINPEKIEIFKQTVSFLGHQLSENGILPQFDKIAAIMKIPPPKNLHDVLSFTAMINFFRQFIPSCSELSEPLIQLTRKNQKFLWSEKCQENFEKLKNCLCNPPLLAHMSELDQPDAHAILMTDASDYAIGSCLAVLHNNIIKPCGYASRVMQKAEKNYSTYEKEALAVVWAITHHFKYTLLGRKFFVLTDHRPLITLKTTPIDVYQGRMLRWRLNLQRFDFRIMHIKGKNNVVSDALSRLIDRNEESEEDKSEPVGIVPCHFALTRARKRAQENTVPNPEDKPEEPADPVELAIKTAIEIQAEDEDDQILIEEDEVRPREAKLVTDPQEKQELMKLFHINPVFGGHCGVAKCLKHMKQKFYWKGMSNEIHEFINQCEICQKSKYRNNTKQIPMGEVETYQEPFSHVIYDITGPYLRSPEGFQYVLSLNCLTTRFAASRCLKSRDTNEVANAIFEIFLAYGMSESITSDNAPEMNSKVVDQLLKLMHVKKRNAAIYSPRGVITERFNGILKNYLRCYLSDERIKDTWPRYVNMATYVFNTSKHSRSDFSPFMLFFARPGNDILKLSNNPVYTYETFFDDLRQRIQTFNKIHKERAGASRDRDREKINTNTKKREFAPQEKALLKNFTAGTLDNVYNVVTIVKDISDQNAIVKRGNREQVINKRHLFKCAQKPNKESKENKITEEPENEPTNQDTI